MRVKSLEIQSLRVILNARFEPASSINWIVGKNGAGKTTLLEAVFLLARGRSFRKSRQGPLASVGTSQFRISGRLVTAGVSNLLDLKAVEGRKRLYLNGDLVSKARDLRGCIQVRILTENSQRLLEGQPTLRRLFLDWNLFHVEHVYADLLERFTRALSQRNAWLRSGGTGKAVWDAEYVHLSSLISNYRKKFVNDLQEELNSIHSLFPTLPDVSVALRQGWRHDCDLVDILCEKKPDELQLGYTRYGPSRADLTIHIDGIQAIGSRGQSKLVVALLQLAAQRVCERDDATGACVWLLDDLKAELDPTNFNQVWKLFEQSGKQIFVTSLDYPEELISFRGSGEFKMFHVEQGVLAVYPR